MSTTATTLNKYVTKVVKKTETDKCGGEKGVETAMGGIWRGLFS